MKTTKIIITCDLCGKEIAENEAATFTLPTGVTYDFCLDCAKRIVLLASKEIADVPVDEPTADEPKVFIPQGEAPQELIPTPPEESFFDRAVLGAKCEAVRKKLRLSREEYASKLGVCPTTLLRIERNEVKQHKTKKVRNAVEQIIADYDWHCC